MSKIKEFGQNLTEIWKKQKKNIFARYSSFSGFMYVEIYLLMKIYEKYLLIE